MAELLAEGGCYNSGRFAVDGAGANLRTWSAPIDTNVTVDINLDYIVAACFDGDDMNEATNATFKLQFRNITDTGSWTDVGSATEIRWASTTDLTQGNAVAAAAMSDSPSSVDCTTKGWTTKGAGYEQEGANQVTYTAVDDELFDIHWAIDVSTGGDPDDQYEFRIVQSNNTVIGTMSGKLTIATPLDLIAESRDDDDSIVGSVGVVLFERTGTFPYTYTQIDSATTHASLGTHTFQYLGGNQMRIFYMKELTPDQWDMSDEVVGS